MKDSGIEWVGEIPEEWQIIGVTKCCNIISGTGFPIQYQGNINNEFPFYKVSDTNLENNTVYMNNCNNTIKKEEIKNLKGKIAPKNSIIFPKIGAVLLKNKRRILTKPSIFDNNMMALVPKRHHEKFLYYFLLVEDFLRIVNPGPVPSLGDSNISLVKVPLLPKIEQNQIAEFLDSQTSKIDLEIEKNEKLVTILQEKKQATINHAVTKGLDDSVPMKDSGIEWIGEIPEEWKIIKLNLLTEKIGDGIHSTPNYVDESEYFFVNGNNLINGKILFFDNTKNISKLEYEKFKLDLHEKTVFLSINGTIGNVALYNNEKIMLGKSACYMNCNDDLDRVFFFYLLKSFCITTYFKLELTGTTIFNLSLESIKKTPIPLPILNKQKQIAEFLDKQTKKFDELISKAKLQIKTLQEYRQSLISSAVTGKIDVREAIA